MIITKPQLLGGADHAVGDVAVRLARRDAEATGKYCAGQCDDDGVANLKVVCSTDHAPRSGLVVVRTHIDLAPPDRLAVGMDLDLVRQHLADHKRTGDLSPDLVDCLDLQARSDQRLGKGTTIKIIIYAGVLAQPAQRHPHLACPCMRRG